MYTDRTFKGLILATNFAWAIGIVHFHFVKVNKDVKKREFKTSDYQLEVCTRRSRHRLIKFTWMMLVLYVAFMGFRVFQKASASSDSDNLKDHETTGQSMAFYVKMGYLVSAYSLPVVLQYTAILKPRELPRFVVEYLEFYRRMRGSFLQIITL